MVWMKLDTTNIILISWALDLSNGGENTKIFIDGNYFYHTDVFGNFVFIRNRFTGLVAPEPFPRYIYDNQQAAFSMSGGGTNSNIFIDGNLYLLYFQYW